MKLRTVAVSAGKVPATLIGVMASGLPRVQTQAATAKVQFEQAQEPMVTEKEVEQWQGKTLPELMADWRV